MAYLLKTVPLLLPLSCNFLCLSACPAPFVQSKTVTISPALTPGMSRRDIVSFHITMLLFHPSAGEIKPLHLAAWGSFLAFDFCSPEVPLSPDPWLQPPGTPGARRRCTQTDVCLLPFHLSISSS